MYTETVNGFQFKIVMDNSTSENVEGDVENGNVKIEIVRKGKWYNDIVEGE